MNGRRLLFLGVGFYSYDQAIIKALSKKYLVTYLNLNYIQEEYHFLFTLLSRIRAKTCLNWFGRNKVIDKLKELLKTDFDYVFIIKGTYLYEESLSLIVNRVGTNNVVLYLWDSVNNLDNIIFLQNKIARIYSFDIEDCKRYGFVYRPLFYVGNSDSFDVTTEKERQYDLSFVGINHTNRIFWLSAFEEFASINNLKTYFFLSTEKRTIIKQRIKRYFSHKPCTFLHNDVLPYKQYESIILSSKAVVDFPNDHQSGLTIRSIEAMCMGIKLITTNTHIVENPDIPSELYYCVDNINKINDQLLSFINTKSCASMPQRYYLDGFLNEVCVFG